MKVLLVASLAESLINFRGPLIEALQGKGCEIHVAAPGFSEHNKTRRALEERDVVVHEIGMSRTGLNPFSDLVAFVGLLCLVLRAKPEVFMSYTIKPVIYGSLAAWMARVPRRFVLITGLGYAFTGEGSRLRQVIRKITQMLYRIALSRTQMVFFQNPDDQALFMRLGVLKPGVPSIVVNGSGVDTARFERVSVPKRGVRFLMIARLLGDKGVREYVKAAKIVRLKYPGASFDLAGWIDENPDSICQDELEQWLTEGVVNFLGRLDDVRPAIEGATVYVLPSYREGMPRTVLEAMSMGRAIITTDAPGCRETVVHGLNGFLVPVKDVDALAEAMCRFIDEPELAGKMGERSRQIAEEKYDVNKVNGAMLIGMGFL